MRLTQKDKVLLAWQPVVGFALLQGWITPEQAREAWQQMRGRPLGELVALSDSANEAFEVHVEDAATIGGALADGDNAPPAPDWSR
jgi:hypothetical protein